MWIGILCMGTVLVVAILGYWACIGNGAIDFMMTRAWSIIAIPLLLCGLVVNILNLFIKR